MVIGWLWLALMVVLPDKPFADIANIFEEIGILMEVKN